MEARTFQIARKTVLIQKRLNRYARAIGFVAAIVTGVGTILGAGAAFWQFSWMKYEERKTAELRHLSTFGTLAQLVNKSRDIEKRTVQYVKSIKSEGGFSDQKLNELYTKYGSGSAIYTSDDFKEFREIHQFYEELGLIVERGSLSFDIVFELVTFPSDFALETGKLCYFVGQHWFSRDEGIAGMCANSDKLQKRYEKQRAEWRKRSRH